MGRRIEKKDTVLNLKKKRKLGWGFPAGGAKTDRGATTGEKKNGVKKK